MKVARYNVRLQSINEGNQTYTTKKKKEKKLVKTLPNQTFAIDVVVHITIAKRNMNQCIVRLIEVYSALCNVNMQ